MGKVHALLGIPDRSHLVEARVLPYLTPVQLTDQWRTLIQPAPWVHE